VVRLHSLLVQLVCKEGLPFRVVESSAFKAIIAELDPRYKLPTRQALSAQLIPKKYEETKSDIKQSLDKSRATAVTTDMWTSSSNHSFMGVTAHWVDGDFVVHNKCLAVKPAPGSHTADFISTELSSVFADWNLEQSELRVVTITNITILMLHDVGNNRDCDVDHHNNTRRKMNSRSPPNRSLQNDKWYYFCEI